MEYIENVLSTEDIYNGVVFDVKKHRVKLSNDSIVTRDQVLHNGGVAVVAIDNDGMVFMVRQYRFGVGLTTLEIPAGKLEKGEDPYEAAMRELREETGYKTDKLTSLGVCLPTPAYCSERIYLYLTDNLEYCGQDLDENEFLDVEKYSMDTLCDMILNNEITDAKTQIAILKANLLLKNK